MASVGSAAPRPTATDPSRRTPSVEARRCRRSEIPASMPSDLRPVLGQALALRAPAAVSPKRWHDHPQQLGADPLTSELRRHRDRDLPDVAALGARNPTFATPAIRSSWCAAQRFAGSDAASVFVNPPTAASNVNAGASGLSTAQLAGHQAVIASEFSVAGVGRMEPPDVDARCQDVLQHLDYESPESC
jgi:hypothetical protein